MKLREAMCEALVDGWHGDWLMGRVVAHAYRLAEIEPENETQKYIDAAVALKVKYVYSRDRAQTWIARNLRGLNEMLWAGRTRESCIAHTKKQFGIRVVGVLVPVSVRSRDTRRSWNVVK